MVGEAPLVYEEESNKGQFMGVGYSTKRGVVNLELGPEGPPPSFTEAQLDEHIVGVVFSQQHSLKKGRGLFGDKADTAITKELQQIHNLETYDPVYKLDLSQKEKKRRVGITNVYHREDKWYCQGKEGCIR